MNIDELRKYALTIENKEYHADKRVSYSKLTTFRESPLAFAERYLDGVDQEETPAMAFGTAAHCAALEPTEFGARNKQLPALPALRGKAAKREFADILIAHGACSEDDVSNAEEMTGDQLKALLTSGPVAFHDAEKLRLILRCGAEARLRLPVVAKYMTEATFHATICGVAVQCRPDFIHVDDAGRIWIHDLKFTGKTLAEWERGMNFGDYILGDAFYRMVVQGATGVLPEPLQYIGVTNKGPIDAIKRAYSNDLFPMAQEIIYKTLEQMKKADDTWDFPGVDGGSYDCRELQVVPWALKKYKAEATGSESEFEGIMAQIGANDYWG